MFRTTKVQKNILILIGLISLAYITIFLLAPKDVTNYTVADTEYWQETGNRLLLQTAYEYNSKEDIQQFPKNLSDWKGIDFKYQDYVYTNLNTDVLLSRAYTKGNESVIWMDIINSKVGESFHKQNVCVEGAGWTVDNDSIAEFRIADPPNPFTKLYANRLDISKGDEKQIMVYWFMFKKFGSDNGVTMIRISAPVYDNDTETTFSSVKDFLENQLFGAMYKAREKDEVTTAEYISKEYGNKGSMAMIAVLLMPIGMILIGIRKKD